MRQDQQSQLYLIRPYPAHQAVLELSQVVYQNLSPVFRVCRVRVRQVEQRVIVYLQHCRQVLINRNAFVAFLELRVRPSPCHILSLPAEVTYTLLSPLMHPYLAMYTHKLNLISVLATVWSRIHTSNLVAS